MLDFYLVPLRPQRLNDSFNQEDSLVGALRWSGGGLRGTLSRPFAGAQRKYCHRTTDQQTKDSVHGNNPRTRLASWTRLIPSDSAASRIGSFCFRLKLTIWVKAFSRIRNNLSTTSVSPQKKLCKSWTHSK